MILLDPKALWLALVVLLVILAWGTRWRRRPSLLFSLAALPALPHSWRVRTRHVPKALQALGLLLLVVALARPARPEALPLRTEGIDILLALDVSSSMRARDLDPERTRLEVAKDAALAFVAGRPDDRIALVTFARYADLRCPPTQDHDALARILGAVDVVASDSPEDATGLGLAAARGAEVLASSPSQSRVVILLTDGEENVAQEGATGEIPPVHAAQLAKRLGIRVSIIVVGLGRADATGAWRALDTRAVRHLAEQTGGTFHQARDAGALSAVYADIDRLEKAPFEEPRHVMRDAARPFLLLGVIAILMGVLLGRTIWDALP